MAHEIEIRVARSDEPDDAYFWVCSCGRTGALVAEQRIAWAGGRRHVTVENARPSEPLTPREPAVDGWMAISCAVGRCQRTCRTLAVRVVDPLPVHKVGGVVRILTRDLEAWLNRQRAHGAPPRGSRSLSEPQIEEHW